MRSPDYILSDDSPLGPPVVPNLLEHLSPRMARLPLFSTTTVQPSQQLRPASVTMPPIRTITSTGMSQGQ